MTKLLHLFLLCLFTVYEFSSATSECEPHTSNNETVVDGSFNEKNGTLSLPSLKDIAESLLSLFTKEELRELILLIDPDYGKVICEACRRRFDDVEVPPDVFFEMMSKNLSRIPMHELLDVPELLSNGTRLRRIKNTIEERRPIRPRRQIKKRHPSNVPGSSPYVVFENVIEQWIPHDDDQIINRILFNKKDFEDNNGN
ncbi:hypothetical protein FG379_002079 [Cryptosporidium bovis]|uniref:uncharacterized protein n=1 Tax=Cryptosporidium bovis TaxID=310047 RepID=UPI00351A53C6|nr:hypothetical protein FG379_002079 [Cryptosporidium bovis]